MKPYVPLMLDGSRLGPAEVFRRSRSRLVFVLAAASLGFTMVAAAMPVLGRWVPAISIDSIPQGKNIHESPGAHESSPSFDGHSETTKPSEAIAITSDKPIKYISRLLITIRYTGFEPSEITWPSGPVFLSVQNRSGFHEVSLRLDREGGNRLYDVRVPRSKLDWLQVVDLQPGRYILTDAYRPEWACRITVTPH